MWKSFVIPAIAVSSLAFAGYHVSKSAQEKPRLQPPVAPSRTPFAESLAGTGMVEPRSEYVSIGTHVAGVVEQVHVKVGQQVHKGDPLFLIDDRSLRADLAVQKAQLDAARARLRKLAQAPRPEELPPAAAKVDEAVARSAEAEDHFGRTRKLFELRQGVVTAEEVHSREQTWKMSLAQLDLARAEEDLLKAGTWQPDLKVAEADVSQAIARVEQLQTEISRLTVTAPLDAQILQVNIREGEYVGQAVSPAPLIVGDMSRMHVRVEIDEEDIPRFRADVPGRAFIRGGDKQPVTLEYVRAEPYVTPKKSLTGQTTERTDTRVLSLIYAVTDTSAPLFAGQQLDVFLDVGQPSRNLTVNDK